MGDTWRHALTATFSSDLDRGANTGVVVALSSCDLTRGTDAGVMAFFLSDLDRDVNTREIVMTGVRVDVQALRKIDPDDPSNMSVLVAFD